MQERQQPQRLELLGRLHCTQFYLQVAIINSLGRFQFDFVFGPRLARVDLEPEPRVDLAADLEQPSQCPRTLVSFWQVSHFV